MDGPEANPLSRAKLRFEAEFGLDGRLRPDFRILNQQSREKKDWENLVFVEFTAAPLSGELLLLQSCLKLNTLTLSNTATEDQHLQLVGKLTSLRRLFLSNTRISNFNH